MRYQPIEIDEEWEHQGVLYWLIAKADINIVYSRTGDLETSWPIAELGNEVTIHEIEILAYTSDYDGYATPVLEPRIIDAAKQYITTHAQHFVR